MRRLVAVLVVALLAFSLAGCGGGGEETPPAEQAPAETPAAPPASTGQPVENPIADRSAVESPTFEPFPTGEVVPSTIASRVAEGQPMLLMFVDGSQKDTDELRGQVDAAIKKNQGVVDLVTYDLGKYAAVDASGNVVVSASSLTKDEDAKQAVLLAHELGVNFTPYILIVDDQGYIIFRNRGYIDSALLDRQLLRTAE